MLPFKCFKVPSFTSNKEFSAFLFVANYMVTYFSLQVAQYLNLELPILEKVLQKLKDEENREIQTIENKLVYNFICLNALEMLSHKCN